MTPRVFPKTYTHFHGNASLSDRVMTTRSVHPSIADKCPVAFKILQCAHQLFSSHSLGAFAAAASAMRF